MKVKTLKVLLILLLSEGGEDAVDVVVDDAHFLVLGILSLYLSIRRSLQTPAHDFNLHGLSTRQELPGTQTPPDLVSGRLESQRV